jgi:hypothetical protein
LVHSFKSLISHILLQRTLGAVCQISWHPKATSVETVVDYSQRRLFICVPSNGNAGRKCEFASGASLTGRPSGSGLKAGNETAFLICAAAAQLEPLLTNAAPCTFRYYGRGAAIRCKVHGGQQCGRRVLWTNLNQCLLSPWRSCRETHHGRKPD